MNESILWSRKSIFRDLILVFSGIAILGLSAQLVIPLKPIPLTFQSAMVVFLGMIYGSRLAGVTVFGYLLFGGLGLPLFADMASGFGVFSGTTAGYLLGFLPAAVMGGVLAERGFAQTIVTAFLSSVLSVSVIFFFGLIFLSHFVGWHNAVLFGLVPFIMTEPLKLLAISLVIPKFWKVNSK